MNSPALELPLSDALDQVMDLSTKLKDDEEHVIQMLVKYVQDNNLQKELCTYRTLAVLICIFIGRFYFELQWMLCFITPKFNWKPKEEFKVCQMTCGYSKLI